MSTPEKELPETIEQPNDTDAKEPSSTAPAILAEITIEELAVDGICGIY
ncbi:MAG: variant-type mycofactocin precursor [Desulfosarcinaceae bacterium]|nr:variant-type mycofactocin precursor [Desulfosarcinaceae bacterium]